MSHLRRVRWKEGLVLRPHHFQQQERFLEGLSAERARILHPYPWGILRCDVDPAPLDNYTFSLASLVAIFPDGTVVDIDRNARVPARQFESLMGETGRAIDVSLGLRLPEAGRPSVRGEGRPAGSYRYVVVTEELRDSDSGESEAPVELLDHELRLFFAGEPTEGYQVLPLARLRRTGEPTMPVVLAEDYAPPTLILRGSETLHAAARDVVERLAIVVRTLASTGASDPAELVLYQALSSGFPVLRELVRDGAAHPWDVYREMVRIAGALLVRSDEGLSSYDIPAFDHADPAPSFLALRDLVLRLCGEAPQRRWSRHEMRKDGDLYQVVVPPEARARTSTCYLQGASRMAADRVDDLFAIARIASPERIPLLARHALLGIETETVEGVPPGLPPNLGEGRFRRIRTDQAEWQEDVLASGQLAVFVPGAPPDLKLHLVVITGKGKQA